MRYTVRRKKLVKRQGSIMRRTFAILAVAGATSVAGCGQTPIEQAALGGAAGAGLVAIAGGDPLAGAVIGAAGSFAFCRIYPERCY